MASRSQTGKYVGTLRALRFYNKYPGHDVPCVRPSLDPAEKTADPTLNFPPYRIVNTGISSDLLLSGRKKKKTPLDLADWGRLHTATSVYLVAAYNRDPIRLLALPAETKCLDRISNLSSLVGMGRRM